MSGADWVSSHEAECRAAAANFSKCDLMEWAGQGLLRTRAKSGLFSSDNQQGHWREFPAELPEREIARATLGPWPGIPADFWVGDFIQARWGAGTFAAYVTEWSDYHQAEMREYIKLRGVTFHGGDLSDLLVASAARPLRGTLPKNAKPNDRLYEAHAHRAAEMVRSENIPTSEAFRRVLQHEPPAPHLEDASQIRALRQAYDSMYDKLGTPIQNGQN